MEANIQRGCPLCGHVEPPCCRACGRQPATQHNVHFVEDDGGVRPFPLCERCFDITCTRRPKPTWPDWDAIDEMVWTMRERQMALIARLRAEKIPLRPYRPRYESETA